MTLTSDINAARDYANKNATAHIIRDCESGHCWPCRMAHIAAILPDKPMTEMEIVNIMAEYHTGTQHEAIVIIRALKAEGVLYCEDK